VAKKDIVQFRNQVLEDLELIASQWGTGNDKLSKPEYAFNYWILSRIFSIDEEVIPDYITEYNDKAIDCFVDFSDSKELFIIQNKFYSSETAIQREKVADFLYTPLTKLLDNDYKRSLELQKIFNIAKDDIDYKIYFYFFASTDMKSGDIGSLIKNFNTRQYDLKCLTSAAYCGMSEIYDLYYGKNYREEISFQYKLGTINRGTFASLREAYGIEGYAGYYIATPVIQIYKMLRAANEKDYPIFDKNIREYLDKNTVNNGIIATLRSESDRKNFMYYNNGITVICQSIGTDDFDTQSGLRVIPLVNPQIVNGCQTANSINKVLENLTDVEMAQEYKNVYVMLKALVIENQSDKQNKAFYENVVKYTNRQNAVSDKAFTSNTDIFYRMQAEFKSRGFLLFVKPSDAHASKNMPQSEIGSLIQEARKTIQHLGYDISKRDDICIPLEKLLQVFLAFVKDGYYAFTKKHLVLKQGNEVFDNFTSQIHNFLSINNMIKLYCLYKCAEKEQKKSDDGRTPIPYYVVGFLGELMGERSADNYSLIQAYFEIVFGERSVYDEAYRYLVALSKNYRRSYEQEEKRDYTLMIKSPIEKDIFRRVVDNANDFGRWETINRWANLTSTS